MKRQHKTPCGVCPFRRKALPGWLGGSMSADEFAHFANSEARMPCHSHHPQGVDYAEAQERGSPEYQSPQCAGRSIYWANQIKTPRTDHVLTLKQNVADVFQWPHEFLAHHKQLDKEKA